MDDVGVVYLDHATFAAVQASADPVATLAAAMVTTNTAPAHGVLPVVGNGPGMATSAIRLSIVVLNCIDSDITAVAVDAAHGDQSGQPAVLDAAGTPRIVPGAGVGVTATAWMDAPPAGYASVGIWMFDQRTFLTLGVTGVTATLVVRLAVPATDVTIVGQVDWLDQSPACGLWLDPAGTGPSTSAAVQRTLATSMAADDGTTSASVRIVNDISVSTAHVLVFLEASTKQGP